MKRLTTPLTWKPLKVFWGPLKPSYNLETPWSAFETPLKFTRNSFPSPPPLKAMLEFPAMPPNFLWNFIESPPETLHYLTIILPSQPSSFATFSVRSYNLVEIYEDCPTVRYRTTNTVKPTYSIWWLQNFQPPAKWLAKNGLAENERKSPMKVADCVIISNGNFRPNLIRCWMVSSRQRGAAVCKFTAGER